MSPAEDSLEARVGPIRTSFRGIPLTAIEEDALCRT